MYATSGYIHKNAVLVDDLSLEKYEGRKVIVTILDEKKKDPVRTVCDEELLRISDGLLSENMEAYKKLAE